MKPAAFEYVRATSVTEASRLLCENAGSSKLLAGGQSLLPLMNFRMLRPDVLIDIGHLDELAFVIPAEEGGLRIGALTRHHTLETSPLVRSRFPVLSEAMTHVAHLAIRNRGTIGGSLSHADPAAELPMMAVLLDAEIHTRQASGPRVHRADEFFLGPLTTALSDDEIVVEIALPGLPPGTGWGFEEVSQRSGDFAIAAAAATLTLTNGIASRCRLAVTGVDATPLRLPEIEARLTGQKVAHALIKDVSGHASNHVNPNTDIKASAEYRLHLVNALVERVLLASWQRAVGVLQ